MNTVTGAVSRGGQPTDEEKQNAAEFEAFVRATVKERKERPGDDLISTLLAGSGEGVLDSFARQPFPGVPRGDGVLGFIAFWPIGLALLAYMIWSKRMFGKSCRHRPDR